MSKNLVVILFFSSPKLGRVQARVVVANTIHANSQNKSVYPIPWILFPVHLHSFPSVKPKSVKFTRGALYSDNNFDISMRCLATGTSTTLLLPIQWPQP